MCSIIGKADKLESKINDLAEDLEDKIKDNEYKTEDKLKELQSICDQRELRNNEKLDELKQTLDGNTETLRRIEEKFDKLFVQQQAMIENIFDKLAEVDFNRWIETLEV